ncbi:MAG: hypothetical protein M5R41_08320 [Bacteroidia bacterium]|nr:hypothetical protein [Bacteroidia bacterium]
MKRSSVIYSREGRELGVQSLASRCGNAKNQAQHLNLSSIILVSVVLRHLNDHWYTQLQSLSSKGGMSDNG